MIKSNQIIEEFERIVKHASGTKGVKVLREKLERLKQFQRKIRTRLYGHPSFEPQPFQVSDRWIHRKKIRVVPWLAKRDEQYKKALKSPAEYRRGDYGEIIPPRQYPDFELVRYDVWNKIHLKEYHAAEKCIRAIENQGFDEHGGWTSMADIDKHGRGEAINTDIYGIDYKNNLFVVQVRQYRKRYKNGFSNVRKNYFLIGYNENGNPFAHPIQAQTVHAAIKKDPSIESPVRAAQAWIWGIDQESLDKILRNGDVALIPVNRNFVKDVQMITSPMRIIDSHFIYTKKIYRNGAIYAFNPTIRHMKGQHPTQKGKGWYKIMIGNRAGFHNFARPTRD